MKHLKRLKIKHTTHTWVNNRLTHWLTQYCRFPYQDWNKMAFTGLSKLLLWKQKTEPKSHHFSEAFLPFMFSDPCHSVKKHKLSLRTETGQQQTLKRNPHTDVKVSGQFLHMGNLLYVYIWVIVLSPCWSESLGRGGWKLTDVLMNHWLIWIPSGGWITLNVGCQGP